jgi:hypothetical protein
VLLQEGAAFAATHGAIFFETSALTGHNVVEVFTAVGTRRSAASVGLVERDHRFLPPCPLAERCCCVAPLAVFHRLSAVAQLAQAAGMGGGRAPAGTVTINDPGDPTSKASPCPC